MPNYCSNVLTLTHSDPDMIKKVVAALNTNALFQTFHPCPQELYDTISGSYADTAKQAALEQQEKDNVNTYGYANWYDWCISNWGTKWDTIGCEIHSADTLSVHTGFYTAWAPPIQFYEKMMELGFEVKALYYELGIGFAGIWENGQDEYYDDIKSPYLPCELVELIPVYEYDD